jgi:hypothetical protein
LVKDFFVRLRKNDRRKEKAMQGRCDVCLERLPARGVLGINSQGLVGGFGMVTFRADQFEDTAHFDAAVCGPRCAAALYQMKLEEATGLGRARPAADDDTARPARTARGREAA